MLVSDLSLGFLPGASSTKDQRFDFAYRIQDEPVSNTGKLGCGRNRIEHCTTYVWNRNQSSDVGASPVPPQAPREFLGFLGIYPGSPLIARLEIYYWTPTPEMRDTEQWLPMSSSSVPNPGYGASGFCLVFNTIRGGSNDSEAVTTTSGHGSWTDLAYQYVIFPGYYYANVNVTLCYSAFWAARLDVALHASGNRTEPAAVLLKGSASYHTEPDVHVQMGELQRDHALLYVTRPASTIEDNILTAEDRNPESRGILSLTPKQSWLPSLSDAVQYRDPLVLPPLISSTKIEVDFNEKSRNPCLTWKMKGVFIDDFQQISPDPTIASIFMTSLNITNGSAAMALSTVITILSSMAYYDQFSNYAEIAPGVATTYYETFVFPQSFRGFAVVLAIMVVHCSLILLIAATFIASMRLTSLGDHWQSISQIVSPATQSFLTHSSLYPDREVRRHLKSKHRERETASIQLLADGRRGGRVGLVARKAHRRSSHSH
ncbi:hypothetical protein Q7P35_003615 [Cladosporium inversicolor]